MDFSLTCHIVLRTDNADVVFVWQWRLGFDDAMHKHSKGLRRILKLRGKRPPTPASTVLQMLMIAASNR